MTPREIITAAIARADLKRQRPLYMDLCAHNDVPGRIAAAAFDGRPVNAKDYLRICGALGCDPIDGREVVSRHVHELRWDRVSLGLRTVRLYCGHSIRKAAKSAGLSAAALGRIENEIPVAPESLILACTYIGSHPWKYCTPTIGLQNVSREASAETLVAAE